MTNRPIWLASDVIYNKNSVDPTDMEHLNLIIEALAAKGLTAKIVDIGADAHWNVLEDPIVEKDALIVDIYGGMDPGIIYEKGNLTYKKALGKRKDCIVYIFSHPTMPLITNRSWLPRDSTDNYDKSDFKGIEHPDEYLNTQGVRFIEGVTFEKNLDKIVDFIAEQSQFVGLSFSENQVVVGIDDCNKFYQNNKRTPKTVTVAKVTLSFEDFTRLVVYYNLNYDFLQYGNVNITGV